MNLPDKTDGRRGQGSSSLRAAICCALFLLLSAGAGFAQVSPAEILNPQLKAAEQAYFPQLLALNRAIATMKFPFPFVLSRYVGLDPDKQAEMDSRGVEFVNFHGRVVLKITGNYNAAYNADLLTQNQRASRAFLEVAAPVLLQAAKIIPSDVTCNAVGIEISYHVRRKTRNTDFEGKEILVVVLDKADAFGPSPTAGDAGQQEILNRSEVYLNGQEYGLALDEKEPLNLEALGRADSQQIAARPAPAAARSASGTGTRGTWLNLDLSASGTRPGAPAASGPPPSPSVPETQAAPAAAATPADAEQLQAQYQSQLEALVKEGAEKFQFASYAPPSFVIFRNQVGLQLTLRNSLRFEAERSSIYRRAAQSFDLFLAPRLKALLEKLPPGGEFEGLDITLLNQLGARPSSSEALEFICSLKALRQFADADITNQELINQSIVLVNGVRIALNLRLVE